MRRTGMMLAVSILGVAVGASTDALGEGPQHRGHSPRQIQWLSGTYLDPAIPRPDLLPHLLGNSVPEHRQVYNRPRYGTGKFLFHFEPTSQEAMAWETNVRNGNYRNHRGASVPMYWYPKPWEALNTRARPDFQPADPQAIDRLRPPNAEEVPSGPTLMELAEPTGK